MPRSWWCRACNYNWLFVDETTWKGKNRRKGHLVIILYIKTMIACTAMTKSSTVSNIFPLQQYISSPIIKSQCLYTIAKEADVSGTVISYIDADTFLNPLYWSKLSEKDTKVIKERKQRNTQRGYRVYSGTSRGWVYYYKKPYERC